MNEDVRDVESSMAVVRGLVAGAATAPEVLQALEGVLEALGRVRNSLSGRTAAVESARSTCRDRLNNWLMTVQLASDIAGPDPAPAEVQDLHDRLTAAVARGRHVITELDELIHRL